MIQKLLNFFSFSTRYWVVKSGGKWFVRYSHWPHADKQQFTVKGTDGSFKSFETREGAVEFMLELDKDGAS